MTTLYLIRHGETDANKQLILQGNVETNLTELNDYGRKLTTSAAARFSTLSFAQCLVSPLKRAQETAHLLFDHSDCPIKVDNRLAEINYGIWNGQSIPELMKKYPQYWRRTTSDVCGHYEQVSNGESIDNVDQRVSAFLNSLHDIYGNQYIAIVTHGYIIQTILRVLQYPHIQTIKNLQTIEVQLNSQFLLSSKNTVTTLEI
ncbi:phosphoglycerate mutase [Furfurilactobacillus rossiae]|uniref:histidine phosphatase family protein n=1 Tax=Furfurilactobacillus rossiae TaxID=231049 RepID=UPI0015BA428D|nr:histidine phosphatase family protein [Furfurilactobacillus rossiae]MCF6165864.1 histidine phosphatase family protein [Furfurilactobacillus rossiae]QLE64429.1 phosphoglycerate mutase [Furfurilactobacillus rossiae]